MPTEKYPWYEVINNTEPIHQGDFFLSCPVLFPQQDSFPLEAREDVSIEVKEYDVIVMTQSCDLVNNKVELVLVCPIRELSALENNNDFIKSKAGKEALRKGNIPGYHLLHICEIEAFKRDYVVVDFRTTYSLPFEFLSQMAQNLPNRLRLLPPYREQLSQAYARFFMRVGLPLDIPPFH